MSAAAEGDWYAVVDTARDPSLFALVQQCATQQCLIAGDVPDVLARTLPYIARLDASEPLGAAWRTTGAGANWGIVVRSGLPIDALRRHFKKFLQAQLPDGTVALFRFYDPRVFATYMIAAVAAEREPWFAGVSSYLVEDGERGATHRFSWHAGALYDADVRIA